MAGNQELFQALSMFKDGVKELQFANALRGANQQVQEIKGSALKEEEQRAALSQVANSLTMQMAAGGIPATTIQQVAGAVGPRRFTSPGEMAMEGVLSNNPRMIEGARQADLASQAGNIEQARQAQEFQAKQNQLNRDNALQLAGMKGATKGQLSTKEVEKIQEYDQVHIAGQSLLDKLAENSSLVGPIAGRVPGRSLLDPDFDTFRSQSGQFFDKYRVAVTGAGASPGELKMLEKNIPSITDPPENFKKKMGTMLKIGEMVKRRWLQNLKKAGRRTEAFEETTTETPSIPSGGQPSQPDWSSYIKK